MTPEQVLRVTEIIRESKLTLGDVEVALGVGDVYAAETGVERMRQLAHDAMDVVRESCPIRSIFDDPCQLPRYHELGEGTPHLYPEHQEIIVR